MPYDLIAALRDASITQTTRNVYSIFKLFFAFGGTFENCHFSPIIWAQFAQKTTRSHSCFDKFARGLLTSVLGRFIMKVLETFPVAFPVIESREPTT